MYEDDWGETAAQVETPSYQYEEEMGRSSGKGRGFIVPENNNDDWGLGKKGFDSESRNDFGGYDNQNEENRGWGNNRNGERGGRGGGGRGRGSGRGGRGGGRGGFHRDNENFGGNDFGNNDGGGFKSSGGRRNFGDDDDGGYKPSGGRRNFGDHDNGGYKPSGGRRNFGDDDDSGGYKPSGGRRNFGDDDDSGGYKPSGGRRNFGDDDDNGGYKPSGGRRNFGDDDDDNGGFKPSGGRKNFGDDDDGFGSFRGDGEGRGGRRGRGGRGGGGRGGRGGDDDTFGGGDFNEDNGEKPKPEHYIPPDQPEDENLIYGSGVAVGINFDKYDSIDVRVSGENVPKPIETFEQANLRGLVLENISKSGYTKPTPVQKHALPIVMNGRDLMACAQTGSGKTAAFAVPIINTLLQHPTDLVIGSDHCEPQVVIVSPTRELTIQIWQQMHKFALHSILKTVVAYGGTSVIHQSRKLYSGCHILVATPGRLLDFVDKGKVTFSSVRFLVLDEADRMLDMGFRECIDRIVNHETMVPVEQRQTLMFSATFPDEIQEMARQYLNNYLFLAVGIVGGACTDVDQHFYEVESRKKMETLTQLIKKENDAGTLPGTLVFVEHKKKADFLATLLSERKYPTTSIHGDRLQRQREEALADFKSGRMSILVATGVASRGLDIKNVSHVINYDMPSTIDEYVHRIGRTGRVGNRGRATSFFDSSHDSSLPSKLVRILKQAGQKVPDFLVCDSSRNYVPGQGDQFGGEDIRDFGDSGTPYPEEAYAASARAAEPEEAW